VEAPLVVADGASVTAGRTATAGRRGRGTGGRRGEGDGVFKDNAETQRSRRLAEIPPSFVGRRDLCEAHATAWHGRLLYVNVYLWDSIRMPVSFFSNTLLGIVDSERWSRVVCGITNRRNLTQRARSAQRAGSESQVPLFSRIGGKRVGCSLQGRTCLASSGWGRLCRPYGAQTKQLEKRFDAVYPGLTPWAKMCRPYGAA
jgi:hypothetical protein